MISIIVPTYNEEKYIGQFIENLLSQDISKDKIEIIIADGRSKDQTRQIISSFQQRYPFIILIDNPDRFVPQALNKALSIAKGEIIIRLDAHSIYPENYISRLSTLLIELNGDNVGGMWITEPGDASLEALAIALATTDKIGIGNASYRLGADKIIEVDTVPYGCFRKDLFERIGTFDTDLLRNQDDEFNGRIKKSGGKIYLDPQVKIRYFARSNFQKMCTMFYQYGEYKPLVMLKLGAPANMRQFAPPLIVLAHFSTLILFFISPFLALLGATGLLLYYLIIFVRSFQIASFPIEKSNGSKLKLTLLIFLAIPQIHFSYGWGYIIGWIKFGLLKKHLQAANGKLKENR